MIAILEIVLAAIVVLAFGIPFVIAFDKAKKEMIKQRKETDEDGKND